MSPGDWPSSLICPATLPHLLCLAAILCIAGGISPEWPCLAPGRRAGDNGDKTGLEGVFHAIGQLVGAIRSVGKLVLEQSLVNVTKIFQLSDEGPVAPVFPRRGTGCPQALADDSEGSRA